MTENHCKDCCCARSWEALGIQSYTGRSIPEHIELLRAENSALKVQNNEFELAAHEAIGNKERAENDERIARIEIDRLYALIVRAKATFDDIASVSGTESPK